MPKRGGKWLRMSMTRKSETRKNVGPRIIRTDGRPREEYLDTHGQSHGSRTLVISSEPTNCWMMV